MVSGIEIGHPQVVVTVRTPYETVLELLEDAYEGAQKRCPEYGPEFRAVWDGLRADILDAHHWTEPDFYAEMDRRRRLG